MPPRRLRGRTTRWRAISSALRSGPEPFSKNGDGFWNNAAMEAHVISTAGKSFLRLSYSTEVCKAYLRVGALPPLSFSPVAGEIQRGRDALSQAIENRKLTWRLDNRSAW